jgi:hypothetical protein
MRIKINHISALLVILFLLAACQGKTGKKGDNNVSFATLKIEKKHHLKDNPDYPNCDLQINFTYPSKAGSQQELETLQYLFVDAYFGEGYGGMTPADAVNGYTEDYIEAYKELEGDFEQDLEHSGDAPMASWYAYYEMSDNEVTYNSNGLICFVVNFENYTGGAHGAHSYINRVIHINRGYFLYESYIFVEGFKNQLAQLLVDKIAANNKLSDPKELENIGFFSVEEIYPNGNFLVSESGITYTFNEYEIAAYVVGAIQVELTYKELQSILLKDSPISLLF